MLEIYNGRDKFYQWDVGQKLIVDDGIIAVQYDNGTGDALVCGVYEYEGKRVADVPNIMLQTVWAIKCYAYCGECVRAERVYEVEKRSRPDDYIYTETETLRYSTLLDMLNLTNDELEELKAKHTEDVAAVEEEIDALEKQHKLDVMRIESNMDIQNTNIFSMLNENINSINSNTNSIADLNKQLKTTNSNVSKNKSDISNIYNTINTINDNTNSCMDDIEVLEAKVGNNETRIDALEKRPTGGGGGGTASKVDWAENNPESPAYIKNRTHYENPNEYVEVLAECSPDEIAEDDGMMAGIFINPIGLEAGKQYKVNWNGVEYECVAVNSDDVIGDSGIILLGDYGLMMGGTSTGEPFIIMDILPEMAEQFGGIGTMMYLLDGTTTLTLKIDVLGGIKKLDNKYLDLSNYYTKDVINQGFEAYSNMLENYYTKSDIDEKIAEKPMEKIAYQSIGGESNIELSLGNAKAIYITINVPNTGTSTDEVAMDINSNNGLGESTGWIKNLLVAGESRNMGLRCYYHHTNLKVVEYSEPTQYAGYKTIMAKWAYDMRANNDTVFTSITIKTHNGSTFPESSSLSVWGVKA